jgi:UDP-2,4-diacetamido-2,4,6-trideoxy-beta-L-altropyranose hydrolase
VTGFVVLVADAGMEAGLGHISRSSAVAVALRSREIETRCYAYGAQEPIECDAVAWLPLKEEGLPAAPVLVIDSYRLSQDCLARAAQSTQLVVMHDYGNVPTGAALVINAAASPSSGGAGRLSGFAYAALRPQYWGLPSRTLDERVRRILVTTGSGQFADVGRDLARILAEELREATVALIHGPHATIEALPGVEVLDAPDSVLEPLLGADLVISAAGQTMLEAAATGTPCIALPLAENQRGQAARLADLGAVRLVDPPRPEDVTAASVELAQDAEARHALSRNGQRAVDGYGALRVAFQIERLATPSA